MQVNIILINDADEIMTKKHNGVVAKILWLNNCGYTVYKICRISYCSALGGRKESHQRVNTPLC